MDTQPERDLEAKKEVNSSSRQPYEEKAEQLWNSFKDEVYHKNRYFIKNPLLDFVKQHLVANHYAVASEKIYFRARIMDNELLKKKSRLARIIQKYGIDMASKYLRLDLEDRFWGLDESESFVPTDNKKVRDGRANPKFIPYLYVAEDEVTALKEVRSLIYDRVSLAEIMVQEDLKVADLDAINIFESASDTFENRMINHIVSAFSSPTNNPDEYLPAQVISEYIKSLGYDGVRFPSSLHRGGYNVTIFNHNKCKAISSVDIQIEDFKITVRSVSARGSEKFWRIVENKITPIPK